MISACLNDTEKSIIFNFNINNVLSTHADKQGVDISFTVCVCVITETDFSVDDKASGVSFSSAVHRRKCRVSQIFVNFAPQKPKIGRIGQRVGHANPHVNITVEMRRRKLHAIEMRRS